MSVLRQRPARVALAVAVGLLLGLAVDVARSGGPSGWLAGRGPAVRTTLFEDAFESYVANGRRVDVGGRAVYLDCRGSGETTVVLEAGLGSGAAGWGSVLDEVATFARVCAWDRPGLGRSDPRGVHNLADAGEDLRAALAAAGERPPYVLAGHSLGGLYARVLADRHPDDVVGLVMIDAWYPDLHLSDRLDLPADYVERADRDRLATWQQVATVEELDWQTSRAQLEWARPHQQPAVLLAVDQRYRFNGVSRATESALIRAWEVALRERFPRGAIVIAHGSQHWIHLDRPELVIEAIRRLVDGAGG